MRLLIPLVLLACWATVPNTGRLRADDDLVPKPKPKRLTGADWLLRGPDYRGTVTAVTDRTIAIAHQGTQIQWYNAAGQKIGGEVIPPQPPLTFHADKVFADRGFSKALGAPYSYRWSDVKIGDRVDIRFERVDGKFQCTAIAIRRRPGGRIPPGHVPDLRDPPYHEYAQALQDFEEKGIPLPAKYLPPPLPPNYRDLIKPSRPYVHVGPGKEIKLLGPPDMPVHPAAERTGPPSIPPVKP